MGEKVLMLLTNGFRPDPRVAKEAAALVEDGYDVTVLAWDRENAFPDRTEHRGARIERLRTAWAGSMPSFILNYPLFFLRGLMAALRHEADIVHCHDLDTLPLGALVCWLKRVPLVFDAHEHYALMIAMDTPGWVPGLVERMEAILTRRADLVITTGEAPAAHLRPHARRGVVLVENCIDIPDLPPASFEGSELRIFYLGTLEPMRYIVESMKATKRLENCVYEVAGWGRLEEEVRKEADGANIRFLGAMPHPDAIRKMAYHRCGAMPARSGQPELCRRLATKVFEAMAVGVPVLTTAGTVSGELVSRSGCGLVIEWSEENYRAAIERFRDPELRRKCGAAGREAAVREYNWGNMKGRLLAGYRSALERSC